MRSTEHPRAWQYVDDMVFQILHLYKFGQPLPGPHTVKSRLVEFLTSTPCHDVELSAGHLQVFLSTCSPAALVMLYMSPKKSNKACADESIKHFIQSCKTVLPKTSYKQCAVIVLEFCKCLKSAAGSEDPLYIICRSCLGSMVDSIGFGTVETNNFKSSIALQDIWPFVCELASKLSHDLVSCMESSTFVGPSLIDVRDFIAFVLPLRNAIHNEIPSLGPIALPLREEGKSGDISSSRGNNALCYGNGIKFLHSIFCDLLGKMDLCLKKIEEHFGVLEKGKTDHQVLGWSQYLTILKELHSISRLYNGAEDEFWFHMRQRKAGLCYLIVRFAKRTEDNNWILGHKDVMNFEARRHLSIMVLPEVKDEYEELHEMLIDRSQLLAESFEYIAHAEPDSLRNGLFMEFKNEEATGPGVLREWFFLVCQAIFNPQNALFVACPTDRRRFFPNPASKVDPLHLEYFKFSGRVIALALMHKVQVGIVLDRAFFMQLAGMNVSLEDIQDADPYMYSSCKQILEMDADIVDGDALGLTFTRDVEELGSMKVVELCPDGRNIIVNSKNRRQYVDLLIQHRFVTSIGDQVRRFAQGFSDIAGGSNIQLSFFRSIDSEDLNWMLHGNENTISVEDWKAHTEYSGYKDSDIQIHWFWEIVGRMTAEQRKILLFFWTSIKHLPIEGFGGLASRLFIYKTPESCDRLPSSHTCFFRLCFPPYPSLSAMQNRISIITQEYVGCSFGTW